jgi:hypothetical protein
MLQKLFVKIFRNVWNPNSMIQEAKPYVYEYDRPIPNFNEYTENLIKHKFSYEPQRHSNPNDLTATPTKRGGRVKGRS